MKFIELTDKDTGKRIAIDAFSVVDVHEDEDCTVIYLRAVIGKAKDFALAYEVVSESYEEVMFQLQRSCN